MFLFTPSRGRGSLYGLVAVGLCTSVLLPSDSTHSYYNLVGSVPTDSRIGAVIVIAGSPMEASRGWDFQIALETECQSGGSRGVSTSSTRSRDRMSGFHRNDSPRFREISKS